MNHFSTYDDEQLAGLLVNDVGKEAFEELYNRYWKKLLLQALHKLGSEEEAEEVVQIVFLNIWRMRKDLRIRNSFRTYISSCVKYEILTSLSQRRKNLRLAPDMYAYHKAADNQTVEWIDFESTRKQLEDTIGALPEKCRLVFRLSREGALTEKQIAKELNISVKTVQAHKTKALKVLRSSLRQLLFFQPWL